MTVQEWYAVFEEAIPASLSCDWDHDGIQCMPDPHREVRTVLCVLDATEEVVDFAASNGVDLIISHHPLLFRPLYQLTTESKPSSTALCLVREKIALFSFHTRADAARGGVSDLLASRLGLSDVETLDTDEGPLLRIGLLPNAVKLADLARTVCKRLDTDGVVLSCDDDSRTVRRVALSGGEGGDFVNTARAFGADVYISGNVGYHRALEACEGGMAVIEAGHAQTEREVAHFFAQIAKNADASLQILFYAPNAPRLVGRNS